MTVPQQQSILVAGGGGFIGGHLAGHLLRQGYRVRCVDSKPFAEWYQLHDGAENLQQDLSLLPSARLAVEGVDEVFNLAADMGGMGFIERNKALCMLSVLINTHLLVAARDEGVSRYFYSSSACVYNADKQRSAAVDPLREEDAYPALPEDGYGWEKLFSERMCRHFREDFGLETRVARFHNVYGPWGAFAGGREKAPAAICRKVIEAKYSGSGEIQIWGDGSQTRSFTYVDDCIHGIELIHGGDETEPLNLGSSTLVSIDELVSTVEEIAGTKLRRCYQPDAPKGVNGRNSDNERILGCFDWEPGTTLADGMERTYAWIHDRMLGSGDVGDDVPSPFSRSERWLASAS